MNFGPRFSSWKLAFFSAVVLVVHGACQSHAFAGAIATPTGLNAGDQFRFIFVTPTTVTNAISSDISHYNGLVDSYASGFTYNGITLSAKAIVSTTTVGMVPGVHAINNVGVNNVAVYMAGGQEVAASDANASGGLFYADTLLNQPVQDLSGTSYDHGYVWTGSSGNGVEYFTNVGTVMVPDFKYWGAGSSNTYSDLTGNYDNHVEVGDLSSTSGYTWLSLGFTSGLQSRTQDFQLYGLSQVFTVPGAAVVPEPSTFLISGLGILMVGLAQRNRKRN
jgi:hypothetical protein